MTGIFLTILGSIALAFADAGKKVLSDRLPVITIIWGIIGLTILANIAIILVNGVPQLQLTTLLPVLLATVVMSVASEILFLEGTKLLDFSLSQPLLAVSPLIALPVGYFLLGDIPSPTVLLGVLLSVVGIYALFAPSHSQGGTFAPLLAVAKDHGARMMILCQILAVILGALQRVGAEASSPFFYFTLMLIGTFLVISGILIVRREDPRAFFRQDLGFVLGTSALWAIGLCSFYLAYNYTLIVVVCSIGLLQPLVSVGIGHIVFKEKLALVRLWPCALLVAAGVLVAWA